MQLHEMGQPSINPWAIGGSNFDVCFPLGLNMRAAVVGW